MKDPVKPSGTRRQAQAAETRKLVLSAARRLFAERGYSATTMAEIAVEAGVVQQTIYDSFGSKRGLILALLEVMDEEAGIAEIVPQIAATDDPRQALALGVRLTRQLNERCADLVQAITSAAPVEPDVAAAYEDGMARHRAGVKWMVDKIARADALREWMTAEEAAAIVTVMTAPSAYTSLHKDFGWSFDECEERLTSSLAAMLIEGEPRPRT